MAFYLWSTTPSSDATADPSINWAEGMAPSAVNDSARAMMARLREYGNDISGAILTSGSATNYTVASFQIFDTFAHMNGQVIAFTPHVTNNATVTLNVDSLGGKPLRSSPGTEIVGGTIVQGTPYMATYNNSDGAFYLMNFYSNSGIPIGAFLPYTASTAPNSSFVLPYGQAISRTTYATYFALVSTYYGVGDGATTFNVPDLRGYTVAGIDNMGGVAAGRIGSVVTDTGTLIGTTLGSTGGSPTHVQTTSELASHAHGVTDPGHQHNIDYSNSASGGATNLGHIASGLGLVTNTETATTGISVQSAGSGVAMALLQPTVMMPYILRII